MAILIDLQGPKIRLGEFSPEVEVKHQDIVELTTDPKLSNPTTRIFYVDYPHLIDDVKPTQEILLDNGTIKLVVKEVTKAKLKTQVQNPGIIKPRKTVNIPRVKVKLPVMNKKDLEDVDFAVKHNADFVCLSFAREAKEVKELRHLLDKNKSTAKIVIKVEDHFALKNLQSLIKECDGVIVARGDLGAEIPLEEVPIVQNEIVNTATALGKPVIVATHMLDSMTNSLLPTRAEATDVAHAIWQQVDSVMLSQETSIGNYPVQAVATMSSIIKSTEANTDLVQPTAGFKYSCINERACMAGAAVNLAKSVDAQAIVTITRRGGTARSLAVFKPSIPIFAFTNITSVRRRLNLVRSIYPFMVKFSQEPEKTIMRALSIVKRKKLVKPNAKIVVVSDILAYEKNVSTVQLRRV